MLRNKTYLCTVEQAFDDFLPVRNVAVPNAQEPQGYGSFLSHLELQGLEL